MRKVIYIILILIIGVNLTGCGNNNATQNKAKNTVQNTKVNKQKDSASYYNAGMQNLKNKNYAEAIKNFNIEISNNEKNPSAYKFRAFAKYKTQDYSGAYSDISRALQLRPDDKNALKLQEQINKKL